MFYKLYSRKADIAIPNV